MTVGLEGVLAWQQAWHLARTVAQPLPAVNARLDEAIGAVLAEPMARPTDDPAQDVAALDGHAVCGEGPWRATESATLRPGQCRAIKADDPLPGHTDAVFAGGNWEWASDGSNVLLMRDPLTNVADERARPNLGDGIIRQGQRAQAGDPLIPANRIVTPMVLASAAAAGRDTVSIIKPPDVGTIVLGRSLLTHGLPRDGRVRDALGFTVPAFVGGLGARGLPAIHAADTRELLMREIDDSPADLIITTGSTEASADNYVRQVLRDIDAHWLIDGVACTPGAQMLLARLPDGRLLIGLPGNPASALAGLLTLVAPIITAMRGAPNPERLPTATLVEPAPAPEFAQDTRLSPVLVTIAHGAAQARPLPDGGPAGLDSWANADAIAAVPPGAGSRGDVVPLLPIPYGGAL